MATRSSHATADARTRDARPAAAKSVLVAGCVPAERAGLEAQLAGSDLSVVWADTLEALLAQLQRRDMPVLVDFARGAAALQLAREVRRQRPATLMFAMVDARRPDLTTEAVLAGVADVFIRPLTPKRLVAAIERELFYGSRVGAKPGSAANGRASTTSDDLYAHSPAMRDMRAAVAKATALRAGVIVRGEDGSGRQVVARAIHAGSSGGNAPFVVVDCAAFEADALDAEIFGPGSPGGDFSSREFERISRSGRLHDAIGGTLYLRNILDASTRVQARLARVLRDREAVLVETGSVVACDVRAIAGVDDRFDAAVQENRLRDDLYRRLSAVRVEVPPFRARREDLPAITNAILRDTCAALGLAPTSLSRPALALIAALPWRGNAEELRSLLEHVLKGFAGGRPVGIEDVLPHVRLDAGAVAFANAGTLRQARVRFEREYIVAILEQHRGRMTDAAKALGIQRTNLYRKMRALKVTREVHR